MNYLSFLSTVVGGGSAAPAAESGTGVSGGILGSLFSGSGNGNILMIVGYCVVFAGIMWLMSRPQKKREKEMQQMQEAVKVGDSVLLNNGFYGTIADIGDECVVVELGMNKTVKIPVIKSSILAVNKTPDLSVKKTADEDK